MIRLGKMGVVSSACVLVALRSASALACGGGGVTSSTGVTMGAQRVFMSVRNAGTTDIVAQIVVPQTTASYGVLIPVPDEPTLDSEPVSAGDLTKLDQLTQPVITRTESSGMSCGCGSGGDDDSADPGTNGSVTVSSQATIGPVKAVGLTADSGDAVRAWLSENGFSLPQTDAATLNRYVGGGRYFIAIRRAEAGASGGPSSIGIHYTLPGDHRMLSLGFTRIGAGPNLGLTLFLAAPQTVGPSEPFKALTLDSLDAAILRRGDYPLAVQRAVAAQGSKAFVLENSAQGDNIATAVPGLARFIDGGAIITRATTVVAREQISDDVVFATPFQGNVPSQRHVSLSGSSVRYAGMGLLPLVFIARALRRRRPRARH
ncbi:MAG TPA: DUF2330 domain-containing protein [Polyangiaceae bacterium]|nr:DUF2330 domain-containing protein [Polyangiaceae bacterium]